MASLAAAAFTASTITSLPLSSRNCCALKRGQPAFVRRSHGSLALTNGCSAFVRSRPNRFHPVCCSSDLNTELKSTLDKVVRSHKVVLFMKGTKDFPQCGFSHTVVQILKSLNAPFESVNILENEMLRQGLKEYSSWPTFPQLYIGGEFFGGCDITVEAYQSGELQELLEKTVST